MRERAPPPNIFLFFYLAEHVFQLLLFEVAFFVIKILLDIKMTQTLESEVHSMSNLSKGIEEKGRQEGSIVSLGCVHET